MDTLPVNRRLKLKECEIKSSQEKQASSFLIPDQTKPPEEYGTFEVLSVSGDCEKAWASGFKVVVPFRMIETINVCEEETKLVLENYIVCIVTE
jgi:hypothetical protein